MPLLALFDTNTPSYLRGFRGWRKLPVRIYLLLAKLIYTLRNRPGVLAEKIVASFRKLARVVPSGWKRTYPKSDDEGNDEFMQDEAIVSLALQNWVVAAYDPETYDGPVVLFRSERHQTGRFRDPEMGWGKLVRGGLTVHEIPGGHQDMFHAPAVEILARDLSLYLPGPD